MLIVKTKIVGFKSTTIKGFPTHIAIRQYFRYQNCETVQLKLIVTKKHF